MKTQSEKAAVIADPQELCVRFVNTVAWRLADRREERLPSPDALLQWLGANGLASQRSLAHLRQGWKADARLGADLHAAALQLREAIYELFRARIESCPPPTEALALLNAWLARPAPGVELAAGGGGLGWRQSAGDSDPHDLLMPIVMSAATLLTGPRVRSVRQCSDDRGCGWLFVDESRAQNRRWCAMGDCGNRAKAARYRARKRSGHPAS